MLRLGAKYLLTMIFLSTAIADAAATSATSTPTAGKNVAKNISNQKGEKKSDWGGSVSYSTSTNLAASGEKRRFSHSLTFGVSYEITKKIGASLGGGISWKAEGQNITKENENPSWDDISVGLGYGDDITDTMSYSVGIGTGFPTSYESNLEEIKGTLSANSGLTMTFLDKKLSWSHSLSFTKYFQTYDYSIVSGELNVDNNLSYSMNVGYKIGGGFSTSMGYSTWTTKLVNGETTNGISFKSSSGFSLGYTYQDWSFSAGYSVGNYDNTDGYQLMTYDETKRTVRAGVSFGF